MWAHSKRELYLIIASSLVVVIVAGYFPGRVSANLSSCSVTLSPQTAAPGSDSNFTFQITDSSANAIQWVKIVKPGGNYVSIQAAGAVGWDSINTTGLAIFTNGSLAAGSSQGFIIEATGDNATSGPVNWTVLASDNAGGANPTSCSGDLSMTITSQPSVINIANIATASITTNSATVTWDTDVAATTKVNYGLNSSYGSASALDSTLTNSHSVTVSGLSQNTGYHYQVISTTPDGGSAASGDNTFLTNQDQSTPPPNPSDQNKTLLPTQLLGGGIPILKKPQEKIPPTISLSTSLAGAFTVAPTVNGSADDNVAVARIQFSTDGGKNWLPTDQATGLGTAHASFSFTPQVSLDGNYDLVARAIDTSGNIGVTTAKTIIIDKLPPLVGGNILSLGPQILSPDSGGTIISLAGIDQKITLSAIGGPISITLTAKRAGDTKTPNLSFHLAKSSDTGLWSGVIGFTIPGKYELIANAVDGAGNKTARVLNSVSVSGAAHTIDSKTAQPVISLVKVYDYNPESNSWVMWDAAAYGQTNPQITDSHGSFKVFLPPGKYYVQATAAGYHTALSTIFETNRSLPLTSTLKLGRLYGLKLGSVRLSLPALNVQTVNLAAKSSVTSGTTVAGSLIGHRMPSFTLPNTDGATVRPVDLLGRPTVMTFEATWSPTTAEQLAALSQLQANKDINVIPVAVQEASAKVTAYTAIAGLNLTWLADPNSMLSNTYNVQSLPLHYFIDRKGTIQKIVGGVLTKQEILTNLEGL